MKAIKLKNGATFRALTMKELKSILGGSGVIYECMVGSPCTGTFLGDPYSGRCYLKNYGQGGFKCGCLARVKGYNDQFLEQSSYIGEGSCLHEVSGSAWV